MSLKSSKLEYIIFKGLPGVLVTLGGLFLLISAFWLENAYMPLLEGSFTEKINVPFDFFKLGSEIINFEVENFLVFQNYESLPQVINSSYSILVAVLVFFLITMGVSLISTLKKMYFIGGSALVIFFFTFTGVNSLNIGGISTNYPLMILLLAILIPLGWINFFKSEWTLIPRLLVIGASLLISFAVLIKISTVEAPLILLSENIVLPVAVVAAIFLLHIGHAIVSGSTILLIKLNQGVGLKISWHITVISILYFALVLFTLLDIMGEINLPFPTLPPFLLMIIAGTVGYHVLDYKINQTEQVFNTPIIGKSFYLIGFALTTIVWGKAIYTYNQPLIEFFNHIFLYAQIALSLLFYAYVMTNFSTIINKGGNLENVLFKPQFFGYFHMRIGAIMSMVILIIFADGIVAAQLSSASANLSADYYYQTGRPQHARILYENSWMQFIKNDRAKNTAAHLYLLDKQPSAGIRQLEESFDYAPNIYNIILHSTQLHQANKIIEAIFYLEKGLEYFPQNIYLSNNLALLYSKINRSQDALDLLENLKNKNATIKANQVALSIKHQLPLILETNKDSELVQKINSLAKYNKEGNYASFDLGLDIVPSLSNIQTSAIRNQWTNRPFREIEEDLNLIDSMIAIASNSSLERNLLESRIIRTLQENEINESLKYLSGAVFNFPNQADYYQVLAGEILAGQLDFEKAANELELVAAVQSSRIKPIHLAILYFGGKQESAINYAWKMNVDFPMWMNFDDSGDLLINPQVIFFNIISQFHKSTIKEIKGFLDTVEGKNYQADLAYFMILHKGHWLDKSDFKTLKPILTDGPNAILSPDDYDILQAYVTSSKEIELSKNIKQLVRPELSLYRNAYYTPFLMKKIAEEEDSMIRYNILQEAIQHNKDPKLWLAYIRESNINGLGNYGLRALEELATWVDSKELEKLMMDNL